MVLKDSMCTRFNCKQRRATGQRSQAPPPAQPARLLLSPWPLPAALCLKT